VAFQGEERAMMDDMQRDGFEFVFNPKACGECPGYCCCGGSGHVWVSMVEFEEICRFLPENPVDCLEKYFFRVNGRLSCRERMTAAGLACVFFQGAVKKCVIYPVRPAACRSYPFWDFFKENVHLLLKECPGVKKLALER
jgi:Fe-S-cluster containining protein